MLRHETARVQDRPALRRCARVVRMGQQHGRFLDRQRLAALQQAADTCAVFPLLLTRFGGALRSYQGVHIPSPVIELAGPTGMELLRELTATQQERGPRRSLYEKCTRTAGRPCENL